MLLMQVVSRGMAEYLRCRSKYVGDGSARDRVHGEVVVEFQIRKDDLRLVVVFACAFAYQTAI